MFIFASPILKKYSTPLLSLNTLIIIGALVAVCLLPWFFAYASGCKTLNYLNLAFWLKENYFLEQPDMTLTNAYVIELVGKRENDLPLLLSWSSNETYNQIANSFSRAPITKVIISFKIVVLDDRHQ
jgi:hypothetical protein